MAAHRSDKMPCLLYPLRKTARFSVSTDATSTKWPLILQEAVWRQNGSVLISSAKQADKLQV